MSFFANDNAHCTRDDCPKRQTCLRWLALQDKIRRRAPLVNVVHFSPNPEDCKNHLEVDRDALP